MIAEVERENKKEQTSLYARRPIRLESPILLARSAWVFCAAAAAMHFVLTSPLQLRLNLQVRPVDATFNEHQRPD